MDERVNNKPGATDPAPAPSLRVDLSFTSFTEFISAYGGLVCEAGIFLATDRPPDVGKRVTLRFRLDDGFPLILAEAQVVWLGRADASAEAPTGAALRFLTLDERSTTLIDHMVAQQKREGRLPFDLERSQPTQTEPVMGDGSATDTAAEAMVEPAGDPWVAEQVADPQQDPAGAEGAQDVFEPAVTSPRPSGEPASGELSTQLLARALTDPGAASSTDGEQPVVDYAPATTDDGALPARSWLLRPITVVGILAAGVLAIWVFFFLRVDRQPPERAAVPPGIRTPTAPPAAPTRIATAPAISSGSQPIATPVEHVQASGPESPVVSRAPVAEAHPSATPAPIAPASRVVDISWRRDGPVTEVVVKANGLLTPARVRHFVMADPPRYVIRLLGIAQPYQPYELAVATPQLRRIRTGFHEEKTPPELHVVLDLAGPGQRVLGFHLGIRSVTVKIGHP